MDMDMDIESVKKTIEKIKKVSDRPEAFSADSYLVEETTVDNPKQALESFMAAGGQGWLCTTASREIIVFEGGQTPKVDGWPIEGEKAADDGKTSVHLCRSGNGWLLTTIRKGTGDFCPVVKEKQQRRGGGFLAYEVGLAMVENEYRPTWYRFCGFEK